MKLVNSIDDTILHFQIYKEDWMVVVVVEEFVREAIGKKRIIDHFYSENPKDFLTDLFVLVGE